MSEAALLEQTLARLLGHASEVGDARNELWDELIRKGFAHPFQAGASRWSEASPILRAAGRYASGMPLAENIVASLFVSVLGVAIDVRRYTVASPLESELVLGEHGVSGRARSVAHAAVASHLLAEAGDAARRSHLVLLELRGVEAHAGENVAGEPRDEIVLRAVPVVARMELGPGVSPLALYGALARATQIAGLAETTLERSVEYAKTREQFGVSVSSFQAVQHHLARLACEVAALEAALGLAERAVDALPVPHDVEGAFSEIAAAKIQAGVTARAAVEVGHAVHGAIGFAREHSLHRFTQRLMSYRAEYGSERVHARALGARALARGEAHFWEDLARV